MNPQEYYTSRLNEYREKLSETKKRLRLLGTMRLLVFLLTSFGVYYFFDIAWVAITVFILGTAVFLYLLKHYQLLSFAKRKSEAILKINRRELQVLNKEFHHLPKGEEFKNDAHAFSQDIDLFGKGSFFQYLNRTALQEGKEYLVDQLLANNTNVIEEKQEAVKELQDLSDWRQEFEAHARLVDKEISNRKITEWLLDFKPFVLPIMKYVAPVVGIGSLVMMIFTILGKVTEQQLLFWFFVGAFIVIYHLKKINQLGLKIDKVQNVFEQYHWLLGLIEKTEFKSKHLVKAKESIKGEVENASVIIKSFSKLLDAFDQRNNIIISIPANGFFLRDIIITRKIENWIIKNREMVTVWFETIAYFDAMNSLGNFAYNHPNYIYPTLQKEKLQIAASALGHPLLVSENRVDNDFEINQQQFFIITGANMAGKSTFLRTVGLSIVMANVGLPVCAKTYNYHPIKLITSMRTTDSLSDNESYFFSELKRLKAIVEAMQKDSYLIILDEILKGTNSLDKAKGSAKFVRRLVASNNTGIIATHDLSLCQLAEELAAVENHYFDAEIINDELYFDYKFKRGVCQNMNASFLLQKMGIV